MGFFTPILGIRIAQFALSIIVVGLGGSSITAFTNGGFSSPSSYNFIIFCCVWTWLSLAYLLITPRFLPRFHDKFAVLGVEIVANIFWFSGWVAIAAFVGNALVFCSESACGTLRATVAFGCFEWLAWTASLVLVCLSIFKNTNMGGALPMMAAHHAPLNPGVESAYQGAGGYNNNTTPMGFNPSETPAPYSASNTPAPYDPHMQPAHLQAQHTGVSGVSSVSEMSSGPYSGAGGYGQSTPYDPHYSQHQDYSGATEMPAASGYGGQDRSQPRYS